jgi:hypothetical protein
MLSESSRTSMILLTDAEGKHLLSGAGPGLELKASRACRCGGSTGLFEKNLPGSRFTPRKAAGATAVNLIR